VKLERKITIRKPKGYAEATVRLDQKREAKAAMVLQDGFSAGLWHGETLVIEGVFEFEIEDLERIVRVRLINASERAMASEWTYEDTFGDLKEGDLVSVPFGYDDKLEPARVCGIGRGGYDGEVKQVAGKYVRTYPSFLPF